MKKYSASFLILACLGTLSWAQGNKELFDTQKSAQELEIMKGILSTTLGYVAQASPDQGVTATASGRGRVSVNPQLGYSFYPRISAFYLYGQGAVFVVPSSSLRVTGSSGFWGALGSGLGSGTGSGIMSSPFPPTPALAPTPKPATVPALPQPPPPPIAQSGEQAYKQAMDAYAAQVKALEQRLKEVEAQYAKSMETMKAAELTRQASLAQFQQQVEKDRKELEARRSKVIEDIGKMKASLIETLANYGDSLTTVKPSEYVSIVITIDGYEGTHVVSVQKSWITDYKAGRLTMDAFKQKALQYNE
ncbi:MAG: OmpH family outer membrane protein [Acidobacteriia bacterium]|nr:OmpH family outer membrane protein [Terriglobia bacterium]